MQASQKFVNLAYYCRYPTKQLSPFNIHSTTFLLYCPLLLAYHTFNLHCSVFKVRPFRFQLSLKPDTNTQALECLYLISRIPFQKEVYLIEVLSARPLFQEKAGGGPKWTRTTDLTIISRVL